MARPVHPLNPERDGSRFLTLARGLLVVGGRCCFCKLEHVLQLFYHIVWTRRERRPMITSQVAEFLDRLLRSIALREQTSILEPGMMATLR